MDEARLRLVRYVAGHYGQLHGRSDMAVASVVGAAAACTLVFRLHWSVMAAAVPVAIAAGVLTDRYYAERFGRIRASASNAAPQRWPRLFGYLYGLFFAAGILWDERHVGSGLPSVTLLFWSAMMLWPMLDGWPFQVHRLLVVGAALLASAMFMAVETSAHAEEWLATTVCLVCVALFVAGWLDHRLVVRALGDRGSMDHGGEEHEPLR